LAALATSVLCGVPGHAGTRADVCGKGVCCGSWRHRLSWRGRARGRDLAAGSRAAVFQTGEAQSRRVAGASAAGRGHRRYRRQSLPLLRRWTASDRRRQRRDAGLRSRPAAVRMIRRPRYGWMAAPHMLPSAHTTASASTMSSFRGSIPHPAQSLCTLRTPRRRVARDTRYRVAR
jgi:hypothetical protein